jgi:hypothetical protein
MTDTATLLAMPIEELRERVELAERMALAARLTPQGAYDAAASPVNTGDGASASGSGGTTRKRRTKAEIDADNAAAAAAAGNAGSTSATTTTATGSGPTADELMAAMEPTAPAQSNGGELSLEDIGDGDMLAGFEEAEKTPAEYRAMAGEIVNDILAKKDKARLDVARALLVKIGVQKASEVPDDRIKEFYDGLPK